MKKVVRYTKKEKQSLESISKSIQEKRDTTLDRLDFPFDEIILAEYDIRQDRDITKLKKDLVRDGQLQVITLSLNDGIYTVVNGRTRYLAMKELNQEEDTVNQFSEVKVEVYNELTELEQNYLNAQINVSQNPLTTNERIAFTRKYMDTLDGKALGMALGLTEKQVEHYKLVATMSEEEQEAFAPKAPTGHGRGDVKVEEAAKTINAYKSASGGTSPSKEVLVSLGNKFNTLNMTRDIKRKTVTKIAKQTAKLQANPKITQKFSVKEIVDIATKETTHNNYSGGSGDKLPKYSKGKFKIIDKILNDNEFEFAMTLFTEGLYRTLDDNKKIDSETKRIVDSIDEVHMVGNEILKLTEVEDYAETLENKTLTYDHMDVAEFLDSIDVDQRKGFIYVNGASMYAQRPEFMNYLKDKFPNSTIALVVIDFFFHTKNVIAMEKRTKERLTVYRGAKNMDEIIQFTEKQVNGVEFNIYSQKPQKKYIAIL